MFFKNNFLIICFFCFFIQNILFSQIRFGGYYGFTYSLDNNMENIPSYGIHFKIHNENFKFNPFFLIDKSRIDLYYPNEVYSFNQKFNLKISNETTKIIIGLEKKISFGLKYDIFISSGFGIIYLNDPKLIFENSNYGFGSDTSFSLKNTQNIYPLIDTSIKYEYYINQYWSLYFQVGSSIFPTQNNLSVENTSHFKLEEISLSFSRFRPFSIFGINYIFNYTY